MKTGNLADHFEGVAVRRLTPNDCDLNVSNGHELDGSSKLREILGETESKATHGAGFPTRIFYFDDEQDEPVRGDIFCSWYDCRANQPKRRAEWRLYYQASEVLGHNGLAKAGDLIFVALEKSSRCLVIVVAAKDSVFERRFLSLFRISGEDLESLSIREITDEDDLGFLEREMLDLLEMVPVVEDPELLEIMIRDFGPAFPTTKVFSEFARKHLDSSPGPVDPDRFLLDAIDREEALFRILERHLVEERISKPFGNVDEFVSYSLSVHNRRKSRAGYALENHLDYLFTQFGLRYETGAKVEDNKRPDFLFPGSREYFDDTFPVDLLVLLGAKTSCKDRWRQVLSEGNRLETKHLLTIEPAISRNQLHEMNASKLQLVAPSSIRDTYPATEAAHVQTLADFIFRVKELQHTE